MTTHDDDELLSREDIEQNSQLKTERVSVPEWSKNGKGSVLIRELTGSERDAYEASIIGDRTGKDRRMNLLNIRARLVAYSLIDPKTSQRMYSDREIGILGNKSAAALDRVFQRCQVLSGITDEDVKELEGNLESDQSDDSGSDSPSSSVVVSANSKVV